MNCVLYLQNICKRRKQTTILNAILFQTESNKTFKKQQFNTVIKKHPLLLYLSILLISPTKKVKLEGQSVRISKTQAGRVYVPYQEGRLLLLLLLLLLQVLLTHRQGSKSKKKESIQSKAFLFYKQGIGRREAYQIQQIRIKIHIEEK